MIDKKIAGRISRRYKAMSNAISDMYEYDRIRNMEWDGIPGLRDEEYYVEYIDTTGRDIIQQATNVYATQRPKWDVLPRGLGDVEVAEEFERTIEWFFWKAMQSGRKPFNSEAMEHIGMYNKVCGQLEWFEDYKYFCVKQYHPSTVVYEYGSKLQWVATFNNMLAADVIEHFSDYAKPGWFDKLTKGDEIGKALKKIQELVDEDEEQRVMFVDYTDDKRRYSYCYKVDDTAIDDSFGFNDDGDLTKEAITIQDKENSLGFINWAIAENSGDPLLAPLLKGRYYDNINDLESMKATALFRRGLFPMFLQHGRKDGDPDIDYKNDVMKADTGTTLTQVTPPQLDPGYDAMAAQMRQRMNSSLALQNVSQASVSNVQHSTYDAMVKQWLMQYEPNKRTAEKYYEQLAGLMFKWAKKKEKTLKGMRLYSKGANMMKGAEVSVSPDDINLEALYIKCRILANNPTDMLQITNQISMMKQAGVHIPDKEYIEQFDMGDPDMLNEEYEKQEIRSAALQAKLKEILGEVDVAIQTKIAEAQAVIQMQAQQATMAMQAQGQMPGQEAPQQGQPMPSDAATSGQGFNAGAGGMPPQGAMPELTQAQRPQ